MVWLVFILIGVVCVSLIPVRLWLVRLGEERSIGWSLWQLLLWFAVGAVPTYLLGVICSSLKGYGGWQSFEAIAGGFLTGFGVMVFIAVPLVDLALNWPRRPWLRGEGAILLVAGGLMWATLPLWGSNLLAPFATPELRRGLVKQLQSPDDSIRRESADLLFDFGTPRRFARWRRP